MVSPVMKAIHDLQELSEFAAAIYADVEIFGGLDDVKPKPVSDAAVEILDVHGVSLDEIGKHFDVVMQQQDEVRGTSLEPPPAYYEWLAITHLFPSDALPDDGPSEAHYELEIGRL